VRRGGERPREARRRAGHHCGLRPARG